MCFYLIPEGGLKSFLDPWKGPKLSNPKEGFSDLFFNCRVLQLFLIRTYFTKNSQLYPVMLKANCSVR